MNAEIREAPLQVQYFRHEEQEKNGVEFAAVPPSNPRDLIAASLAGGIIAAGGKAVTAAEAVGVFREVREALTMPTLRAGDVGGVEAAASATTGAC